MTKSSLNKLQYEIIGAAIEVHKQLGPGLLESVYHKCMKYELDERGFDMRSEVKIGIKYKEVEIEDGLLRCDLIVNDSMVLELKAVECFMPIHETVLLTYMKLLELPKGLLINFTCPNISDGGYKSFVNDYYKRLPD